MHKEADDYKSKVGTAAFIYVALMTAQIRNILRGKDIVLVYDGWSDRYGKRSYLGIVARYVDTEAKQISHRILAVKDLLLPHTSNDIRACLMDVLQEYELGEKQVKLYVHCENKHPCLCS